MKREKNQQDATIRCLLSTSVSTCFGHHYAHLQENKGPVTAFGGLFWFCWMWLVAVVGRCVVGCEQCSRPTTQRPTTATCRNTILESASVVTLPAVIMATILISPRSVTSNHCDRLVRMTHCSSRVSRKSASWMSTIEQGL